VGELTKIVLTASLTVLGGVIVLVLGQLLGKFVIDPLHEVKKILGEIRFALLFHAPAIMTPVGDRAGEDKAAETLRRLSSELHSKVGAVPLYGLWSSMSRGYLPTKANAFDASRHLMGLSNSVHQDGRSDKNAARVSRIEKLLGFQPWEKESAI
jgi:hypothetical protein